MMMQDDFEEEESLIGSHIEFMDSIGVEDYLEKVYSGRDKDLLMEATDAQAALVEKLSKKLTLSSSCPPFDITDCRRMILHQGKIQRKTAHSLVQMFQKKYLFLLNDVLLVTSQTTPSSIMIKSKESFEIQEVLYLNSLSVNSLSFLEPHESNSFEVVCSDRTIEFQVETESEKRIWVEKLLLGIHSTFRGRTHREAVGWQHKVALGSLHSTALLGDLDKLNLHLTILGEKSPDIPDEVGMCPIHWAALGGQRAAVVQLLDAGSEVDHLNNGLNSPLLLAASQGHDLVVNTLLERGADPAARNLKDRDALFMSALYAPNAKGLAKIFMFLHFRGVDLDRLDSSGSAPLHECAARNLSRPVRLLVEAGAEVNNKHGRSGMTPLQVACCNDNPDVETIRSLLEKGAHPNWKDAENCSAFERVLKVQMTPVVGGGLAFTRTRKTSGAVDREESVSRVASPEQMAQTVRDVGSFAIKALPVLIEIARKGGRYTEESISSLRPSFLAAIDSGRIYWNKAAEPESFPAYVNAKDTLLSDQSTWTSNKASDYCMLCVNKFNYFGRHHCRACGILCCQLCSSKRLTLIYPAPKPGGERVCDGCFNRLTSEAEARMLAVAKADKIMAAAAPEVEPQSTTPISQKDNGVPDTSARDSSFSTNASDPSTESSNLETNIDLRRVLSSGSIPSTTTATTAPMKKSGSTEQLNKSGGISSTSQSAGETSAAVQEVAEALKQRGSKIKAVAEKSEALMEGASDFSRMARQLKKQQQRKSSLL